MNSSTKKLKSSIKGLIFVNKTYVKIPEITGLIILNDRKFIFNIMRTCRALTQPMIERVERVANAAPSTPNFGIKNTFKAKFIEKAIAVFIKTILGNPDIPSVGDAAPNIA